MNRKSTTSKAFTLLYAVLVVGALTSLVFAILNIVYKQVVLSTVSEYSQEAFYAADSGLECGSYWNDLGAFSAGVLNMLSPNITPSIQCEDQPQSICDSGGANTLSDGESCSIAGTTNTPNVQVCPQSPTDTCDVSAFNYSLAKGYSSSLTPNTDVWVYQDITNQSTYVKTAGHNTSNLNSPLAVERGFGALYNTAQCQASEFNYSYAGTRPNIGNITSGSIGTIITPFWPGISSTDLSGIQQAPGRSGGLPVQGGMLLAPAYWTDSSPSNPILSFSAGILANANDGNEYQFGYYTYGDSGNPPGSFIPLIDGDSSIVGQVSAPVSINQGDQIAFGLCVNPSGGSCQSFWSTNTPDNSDGLNQNHVVVFATPNSFPYSDPNGAAPSDYATGRYIFAFDNSATPSSFTSFVVELQLTGCP